MSGAGPDPAAAGSLRLQREALLGCTGCRLAESRTQVVFGVGDPETALMFVGEGPGFNEDRLGEPFVGKAGALLSQLLASISLRREDVYIANVVKCRPPDNRDPLPDEIAACSPHLYEQIRTIRPRVVCTLGRFATRLIAETDASISAIHGRAKPMEVAGVPTVVFPVFHPAAALYTPANRTVLEEDFRKLRRLVDRGAEVLSPRMGERADEEEADTSPLAPDPGEAVPVPQDTAANAGAEIDASADPPSRSAAPDGGQLPLW